MKRMMHLQPDVSQNVQDHEDNDTCVQSHVSENVQDNEGIY